jgi:glycosyltransferase involved in cell wall biosynthesis
MTSAALDPAEAAAPPSIPLASVLIAVYNEEKHLERCLQSLLAQDFAALEIIVIDDGSTDRTVEIVARFHSVRLLRQPHQGKASAVNLGARAARGTVLLFLDGDMYFDRAYVARMVGPILAGQAVGSSHGTEYVANATNIWAICWQRSAGLPLEQRVCPSADEWARGCTIYRAVRRDRFLDAGGFDDIGYFDDQTLYPKLRERAIYIRDAICFHHNPDTLSEVFRTGVWGGKTLALRGGWRALLRYLPPLTALRALRTAWRQRSLAMFPYELVRATGIFYGMLCKLLSRESSCGA